MAANLTAVFELVDRMSAKLDSIASSGSSAVEQWEQAGDAADSAFESAERGAQRTATACSTVATAAGTAEHALENTGEAADGLQDMFAVCEQAAGNLSDAMEATTAVQEELQSAIESAGEASEGAAQALSELEAAQQEAREAMEHYDAVLTSGTDDLGELEGAAERAMHAAERLAEANGKAADETERLGKESDDTGDKLKDTGEKGVSAFEAIGNTLIGAAIAKTLKEAAEAAYELTEAFSEAESTIVIATGASGEALDGLTASMMRAYSVSKTGSLSDTAAAVGEINTRLGQTGPVLEKTTGLFLDFTAVTGGDVAGNVRTVTQLMRQWDIEAEGLEGTLDKLTYAGQASGISVSTLSGELTSNKAILDQLGFSLDESIALFSQFELNGTQAASVMTGFRTALNNGSISSLEDLNEIFDQITAGEISAADAGDIFGARAGVTIVNAVKNGTFALDDMVAALENTQGATVATADAAQTLDQKWEQATNNINAAFTSAISPVTEKLSSGLASVANKVGDFLNQHPALTKAIAAVGVGLAAAAVGIGGVAVASLKAIPALAGFGTALTAAMGPIGWIAAGVAAVTAAVLLLSDSMEDSEAEYRSWTETTRQQYDALQDLNGEYERAVETYGENSDEALYLKWKIDDLTESFENGKQTLEDYIKECDDLADSISETLKSNREAYDEIGENESTTLALVHRLEELATQTDKTVATQEEMKAIIEELNDTVPGLALSYDDVASGATDFATAIENIVKAEAMMQQYEASQEYLVAAEIQRDKAQAQLDDLEKQAEAVEQRLKDAQAAYDASSDWHGNYEKHGSAETAELKAAQKAYDEYNAEVEKYNGLIEEANTQTEFYMGELVRLHEQMEKVSEQPKTFAEAVKESFGSVQEDLDALIQEYDEVYERARSSIDGQIGLFATMKTETTLSVAEMQEAFASQIEYINLYTENLRKASEYGITDGLIQSLSDGSEESAGYLSAIIQNIETLEAQGGTAAADFVKDFNASFEEVETAKDEFADTVAQMETDFSDRMDEIEQRLTEGIEEMNKEADAAEAARATIAAYTQAIRDGEDAAIAAAKAVSSGVSRALKSSGTGAPTPSVEGNASGTTHAADVFVAGEEGPELIIGHGGATVFPTEETERIINAVSVYADAQGAPIPTMTAEPIQTNISHDGDITYGGYTVFNSYDDHSDRSVDRSIIEDDHSIGDTLTEGDSIVAHTLNEGDHSTRSVVNEGDSTEVTDEGDVLTRYESRTEIGGSFSDDHSIGDTLTEGDSITENVVNGGDIIYNYEASDSEQDSGAVIVMPPASEGKPTDAKEAGGTADTRRIVLELNGKGSIEVGGTGGASTEQVVAVLYEYLKPVLVELISEEVFEEGDGSYDY